MAAPNRAPPSRHRANALLLVAVLCASALVARAQNSGLEGPFFGLTDDPCRMHADCVAPLRCLIAVNDTKTADCDALNNEGCMCVLPDNKFTLCDTSADCPRNERCIARSGTASAARCSSCTAFYMLFDNAPVDDTASICPRRAPAPTPLGFADDECDPARANACRRPAVCARMADDKKTVVLCAPGDAGCECRPREPLYCLSSTQCPAGERCAANSFNPDFATRCLSCAVTTANPHAYRYADVQAPSCDAALIPSAPPRADYPDGAREHCPPSAGLTLDHCCAHAGAPRCAFPRRCTSLHTRRQCRTDELECFCFSAASLPCETSKDCPVGERCVTGANESACVSCARAEVGRTFQLVDDGAERCDDTPSLYVAPIPAYASTAGDARDASPEGGPDASAEPEQSPAAGRLSDGALDPLLGAEEGEEGVPFEASETDAPAASSEPDASEAADAESGVTPVSENSVCVGAHHLAAVPRSGLVFARDVHARVLCDAAHSCATEGHVVVWRGEAMTMRAYCARVACTRVAMAVNSVRMRRGVRVASRTAGLEFTALAARWGTHAEEILLRALVRLGL